MVGDKFYPDSIVGVVFSGIDLLVDMVRKQGG